MGEITEPGGRFQPKRQGEFAEMRNHLPLEFVARDRECRYSLGMNQDDEQRIAAKLARIMAMICVRNSKLEDLHAGRAPVTRTGDYTDVYVIDADGQRIPWPEVSRIDDAEMRDLMRQVVDRLYTFHIKADDTAFRDELDRWLPLAEKWDEPKEDTGFLGNRTNSGV